MNTDTREKNRPTNEVFIALAVLTLLEFLISYLDQILGQNLILPSLLGIAIVKAGLVAAFFMGILYEKNRRDIVLIVFIFPAVIALIIAVIPLFG
ncbi:MAG: cytochrome C oxidase subunit IV family protein [Candidatus Thorarchaeota archaeon]